LAIQEDATDNKVIAYEKAESLLADLNVITCSLMQNKGQVLIYSRLGELIKAIETFCFHLATVDIRQSSDVHEAVFEELLMKAGFDFNYSELDEQEKNKNITR